VPDRNNSSLTRRNFLAVGATMAAAAPAIMRGAQLDKEPVRVGHIGLGTHGWNLIKYTGAIAEAKVVALCDVYGPHLKRGLEAGGNPEAKSYHRKCEVRWDRTQEEIFATKP